MGNSSVEAIVQCDKGIASKIAKSPQNKAGASRSSNINKGNDSVRKAQNRLNELGYNIDQLI